MSHILSSAGISNQTKMVYSLIILPLFRHIKHIILEYSVDKGLHLIEILLKMSHVLCRLPLGEE